MNIYLIYVFISFVRGTFIVDGYWDWKNLISNTMCLLIPLVAFASDSKLLFKHIIKNYIYYTAPIFLFIQFFIRKDEFGFYLAPFSFVLLFFPILSKKWKLICLLITLYVIFADVGARSNLIKFIVPLLFVLIYYLRKIVTVKLFEYIRLLLIALPFIFFSLGIMGVFNIFKPKGKDYTEVIKKIDDNGKIVNENLAADTRTFIYVEVLATAHKYNTWVFGRSPARGNISVTFGQSDMNKRNERNANEVSIVNYFTWLGIVGVLLIFSLFYQATYLAVNHSNNIFSKIIGLFIAFRWAYGWVEDINNFYIQYLFLWLFIGLCYSKSFREMTDKQMKHWVRGIFEINKIPRIKKLKKAIFNQL
ncbi:hypothetical protein [Flavobacterium cellulosilyticum]|uniref:O-antigen ligase domain-containing protein n=1 Tax=Flavobacterium cellulosilyticum TaxID=2541731 RepID=A0A4R5C5X6_9FLAO|nr:hypothetical protein [Flavobacterium cellulosilyticum]TDD95068.1 hypothetical protein E0F76_14910 [Flavobacterium cellulosilyticum]